MDRHERGSTGSRWRKPQESHVAPGCRRRPQPGRSSEPAQHQEDRDPTRHDPHVKAGDSQQVRQPCVTEVVAQAWIDVIAPPEHQRFDDSGAGSV